MVAGVGVHVRLVAESLIRRSVPHLNHTVQGQGPRRHRRRTSPFHAGDAQASPLPRRLFPWTFNRSVTPIPSQLRQRLRAQRLRLSVAEQRQAALAVASRLAEMAEFGCRATRSPVTGPVTANWIQRHCWNAPGPWAKPFICRCWPAMRCNLRPIEPGTPLRRNRFQIPEPDVSPAEWLPPSALDLVLTPLVAFDSTGTRLGMGGGFYDRSFAFLRDPDPVGHRPRLIGLAYEFQQVEALVRQPWDVPLDAAATEKAWSVFG